MRITLTLKETQPDFVYLIFVWLVKSILLESIFLTNVINSEHTH